MTVRTSFADKVRPREILKDASGKPKRVHGTITGLRPTFAFVESEAPKMSVFVPFADLDEAIKDRFEMGFPVSFELAFNLKGPIALNPEVPS